MPWVAAVGAVAGGAIASQGAQSGAASQANASTQSANIQRGIFDQTNAQQQPFRQSGYNALGQIATGFGTAPQQSDGSGPLTQDQVQQIYQRYMGRPVLPDEMASLMSSNQTASQLEQSVAQSPEASVHVNQQHNVNPVTQPLFSNGPPGTSNGGISQGQFTHQFNANDLQTNLAPNYAFMLGQGQGATQNLINKSGGAFSGNALKAINDYTQNYASNAYQQAYENYNTNQTNIYNRLASIAGLGQTAGSNSTTGASALGGSIGSATAAAGGATGAGIVGSSNAISGSLNNAGGWYTLGNISNNNNNGGGGSPLVQEQVPGQYSLGNPAYGN